MNARQNPFFKDVFLSHDIEHIDSFGLYVKGSMFLSRVKNYNMRYHQRKALDDPSVMYVPEYRDLWEGPAFSKVITVDPRRTSDFLELDRMASAFQPSFPERFRDPFTSNSVDPYLYAAHMIPHVFVLAFHQYSS